MMATWKDGTELCESAASAFTQPGEWNLKKRKLVFCSSRFWVAHFKALNSLLTILHNFKM